MEKNNLILLIKKKYEKNKMQEGPCLSHCYTCNSTTMIFAHFGMIYCIASIVYLIVTRCVGTPFMDSLTESQKKIKKDSARVRWRAFLLGLIVAFIFIHILKPFKEV